MQRSSEDLEKVARALRELVISSMQSINDAASLTPDEANSVITGAIQSIYAELCAAMMVASKPNKKEILKELLNESFERQLSSAIDRETKFRKAAKSLANTSSKDLASKITKEYDLADDDSDDPKSYN